MDLLDILLSRSTIFFFFFVLIVFRLLQCSSEVTKSWLKKERSFNFHYTNFFSQPTCLLCVLCRILGMPKVSFDFSLGTNYQVNPPFLREYPKKIWQITQHSAIALSDAGFYCSERNNQTFPFSRKEKRKKEKTSYQIHFIAVFCVRFPSKHQQNQFDSDPLILCTIWQLCNMTSKSMNQCDWMRHETDTLRTTNDITNTFPKLKYRRIFWDVDDENTTFTSKDRNCWLNQSLHLKILENLYTVYFLWGCHIETESHVKNFLTRLLPLFHQTPLYPIYDWISCTDVELDIVSKMSTITNTIFETIRCVEFFLYCIIVSTELFRYMKQKMGTMNDENCVCVALVLWDTVCRKW